VASRGWRIATPGRLKELRWVTGAIFRPGPERVPQIRGAASGPPRAAESG